MSYQNNAGSIKTYVENEILGLLKLYTESYMIDSEKGYKTLEDRENRQIVLTNGIREIIQDAAEQLDVSIKEIAGIIKECLTKDEINPKIRVNYAEEFNLIRKALTNIEEIEQIEK